MLWPLRRDSAISPPRYFPVERNLREMMQFFALARTNSAMEFRDGLQLVSSGIDFSPFNSAMLTEPINSLSIDTFAERVETASRFFADRGERWSFWLCHELLSEVVVRRVGSILLRHRLRQTAEPPGMYLDQLAEPARPLPFASLEAVRVMDERTRLDFSAITACTFDLPMSICREVYQNERSWSGSMRGWVGYVNGEPAATCAAVVTDSVIGMYTIGTLPMFRRRGYGEALLRCALAATTAETGITASILQSTPGGYAMYHKLGYRKAAQFSIYLSEH